MKSSSFLCGALLGAGAAIWASRRKSGMGMMSLLAGTDTAMKFAEQPENKGKGAHCHSNHHEAHTNHKGSESSTQEYPSPVSTSAANHSKEYSLKQVTDFIKSNSDVRREVEAILKETNTAIPGL